MLKAYINAKMCQSRIEKEIKDCIVKKVPGQCYKKVSFEKIGQYINSKYKNVKARQVQFQIYLNKTKGKNSPTLLYSIDAHSLSEKIPVKWLFKHTKQNVSFYISVKQKFKNKCCCENYCDCDNELIEDINNCFKYEICFDELLPSITQLEKVFISLNILGKLADTSLS